MKTGLVLEGGGLRGIFTAGVLDVLMEEGVKFDGAVGVSAGAAFGSNYKSEQNRRAIRYNLRFAKDPRYSSIMSLIATGNLFNAQFCYHDIPEKHDPFDWETFRKNPMEFYLVCTDVETGKAVYHLCDNDDEQEMLEWFRASGSMPLVSKIVEIGDRKLLDGGIADSIPLRFMEEQGYERNLVVLTRPANYVKTGNPLMPMVERGFRQYPETVEAIRNRHIVYNEELAYVRQREIGKYAFVIRPDRDLDIGRIEHDRTKIRAAYKAGRRKARKLLPEILTFLKGAKADFSTINASMVEGDVSVSDVVKPSLVEDPTVVPEEKEGFGKSYEEDSEEITGRENKDIPEELFGKVKRDSYDGADEEDFEGAPAPETPLADSETAASELAEPADAESADVEPADAEPAGVTSASLVESFGDEPAETAPEQDEDQKVRVQEVRAVLIPEEEEELPAFQRPFPMGREPDRAVISQEEDDNTETDADIPVVEAAEEASEEAVEEIEAEVVAEAEEPAAEETEAEAEAGEPAAEEAAEEAVEEEAAAEEAVEEPVAKETVEEAEAEEPAAEEAAEEAVAEEPAAEEAVEEPTVEETVEEAEAEEPAVEEAAEEAVAEEAATEEAVEEAEAEEPATEEAVEEAEAEEPAAEEPAAEEAAEEPAVEETVEEAAVEELAAEEPAAEEAAEEPAVGEPAVAEAEEPVDVSEASAEAEPVKETSGLNPFRYRNKGRKQKKVWKPGNMTALKEKAEELNK